MMRVNEHIDAIALARGEAGRAAPAANSTSATVLDAMRRIDRPRDQPDLGHRRLWLDHRGGADPRRRRRSISPAT